MEGNFVRALKLIGKWIWRYRLLLAILWVIVFYTVQFAVLSLQQVHAASYLIASSARFNDDDSAYLSRTPAGAGNRTTFTWSGWVKLDNLDTNRGVFTAYTGANNDNGRFIIGVNTSNQIFVHGYSTAWRTTSAVFRDPSAWTHIVVAVDSNQGTANNRIRIYVNGTEITSFGALNNPASGHSFAVNAAAAHNLGREDPAVGGAGYFDGYLSDVNFVDGQQLTPSSFGETDSNGYWRPKSYTGTYGTNGFKLDFASGTDLGNDVSGNNNDWTQNNLNATDQVVDTPTNFYPTLSPIFKPSTATLSEGNLKLTAGGTNTYSIAAGSTAIPLTGKWYWEVIEVASTFEAIGIMDPSYTPYPMARAGATGPSVLGYAPNEYVYKSINGNKGNNNIAAAYGATFTTGDVVGVAVDRDAGTITFYKNCTSQGQAYSGLSATIPLLPATSVVTDPSGSVLYNFGQSKNATSTVTSYTYNSAAGGYFYCTPPTGYKALSTSNLPEPAIAQPNLYFDAKTYTGNGSTQSITGLNFQPDFVWLKDRTAANSHGLFDAIRTATKYLSSNSTAAETTDANSLTAFLTNGFSLGTQALFNTNGNNYISWLWKEDTTSAFDIVPYVGNGTLRTINHSLGVAPQLIIIKKRSAGTTNNWVIGHNSAGWTGQMYFDTGAFSTNSGSFNNTAPTASIFTVNTDNTVNENTQTFVAYLFAEVEGFSKFGSYTGNGSADGPFVYTGFKPRYVLVKRTDTTGSWLVWDTARDTYNASFHATFPDLTSAESTSGAWAFDFLSNGFKVRNAQPENNASGGTYIYAAFAEQPFKYSAATSAAATALNGAVAMLMGMTF